MLKSFLDPLSRLIKKNRLDFFLNLTGLSVAMVVFIFITLYVKNETSFDKYHLNADRIFRLTTSVTSPGGQRTDMALANTTFANILKNKCPEVTDFVCVDIGGEYLVKFQDKEFEDISIRAASPSIFQFFSYPVIEGRSEDFLKDPNTIILTKSLADKIFKGAEPLGQKLIIRDKDYEVTGIIEDLPVNTDLQFSALSSSELKGNEALVEWGDYFVYLDIADCNMEVLKNKIDTITKEEYHELLQQMGGFSIEHHLQPLTEIHFDTSLLADLPKGSRTNVYVFSIIAVFILIIAAINYINLTIAQLQKRQKEFSIRKTIGCGKKWIMYHVLSESVVSSVFAGLVAVFLALLLLSQFNSLFNQNFSFYAIGKLIIPLVFFFLIFGIFSGLYPAFKSTKTETFSNMAFSRFGKSLVTFQNVVSIIMIAGVFLIRSQIQFMKNYDLGFNKEQLIAVTLPSDPKQFPGVESIRREFSKLPEIKAIAFGGGGTNLGSKGNWMKAIMVTKDASGNDIQFIANEPSIDENYLELFGMRIINGRNFSGVMQEDKDNSVIVNETYVKTMGWDDPLGKYIFENNQLKVIGVVKDFHFDGLHNPIEPLFFKMIRNNRPAFVFLKAEPRYLNLIKDQWESAFAGLPFEYAFMDQHMTELYKKDENEMTIFSYLTLISILISGLGLYGLTAHFIINRTKEIGIRKVNGAKISEVMMMLNRDFVKWVVVAFVIATPVAWYAMHKWLENFAYKTNMSWWIFALAGVLALGIALLTVSWQSWRAATRNPVEALRYE